MREVDTVIELPDVQTPQPSPSAPAVDEPLPALTPEQLSSQMSLLLQSLMDALPDDALVAARRALARRDTSAAIDIVVFAALQFGINVSDVERAVLAECVLSSKGDSQYLSYLRSAEDPRPLLFSFSTAPPTGTSADADGFGLREGADGGRGLVARLSLPSVLGVWRAWRYPVTGTSWPAPRLVYLLEVADRSAVEKVMELSYGPDVSASGGAAPLVEAYVTGYDLPTMLRTVQLAGELVHARDEDPAFEFVDVFEGDPDDDGLPQHVEHVDDDEAAVMLDYLRSGTPLMMADVLGEDIMDESVGQAVPLHLRTDGRRIWSDASAYYVDRHRIAPPPEFRTFLATAQPLETPVSDVVLHQAARWLEASD